MQQLQIPNFYNKLVVVYVILTMKRWYDRHEIQRFFTGLLNSMFYHFITFICD